MIIIEAYIIHVPARIPLNKVLGSVIVSREPNHYHDRANPRLKRKRREENKPEISPQINDLPSSQPNQHPHRPKCKPLDPLVRTLVGIPQLLLSRAQVLHLADDLADHLLNASQVNFDGLELLLDLDAGPVAGVGADVDVEFDRAGGVGDGIFLNSHTSVCAGLCYGKIPAGGKRTVRNKLVLKAHIEGRISGRSKRLTSLTGDIPRTAVVIAQGILDLLIDDTCISIHLINPHLSNCPERSECRVVSCRDIHAYSQPVHPPCFRPQLL